MDADSLDLRDNELDEVASQSVVFDEGSESLFGGGAAALISEG